MFLSKNCILLSILYFKNNEFKEDIKMKKMVFFFCIIATQLIFVGCSNTSVPEAKQKSQSASIPSTSDYITKLNSACKNAYTASVAYTVNHPNPTNLSLPDLIKGGYQPVEGITITTDNLSDKSGTITCSGPDEWKVRPAIITIENNGLMNMTQAVAMSSSN